ncbi:Methylthioribulose-1-phosphate dehydratase [Synechococcus sp. MIT S9508]|nr:Methylthioribulose-1-phosphate dehydratase [Synechococcus sp. MIT S9508]
MKLLHRRGWCDGTGGNFSVVVAHEPLRLLMAPSGVDKGSVQPEELIEVNSNGDVIRGGGKASAETLLHLRIIDCCGAGAVLHTHSLSGTLLSQTELERGKVTLEGWEMLKGLQGVTTHDTSVNVPIIANNQDLQVLSETAAERLSEAPHGLLVSGHGLYAWGDNLKEARRHTEILEFLLELSWRQSVMRCQQ